MKRIDKTSGQTVQGQMGETEGYAVVKTGRGQWWPVRWDGREAFDLDIAPHTLREAERTARYARSQDALLAE